MRLIFNACEGVFQLLLTNNNTLLCAQEWNTPNSSTEILAPAISHILECLNLKPTDISSIACVNGPGSFTGIRLTLATAAAMSRVLNIPVASINYMQALALSAYIYLTKQLSEHVLNSAFKPNEHSLSSKNLDKLNPTFAKNDNSSEEYNSLCWVITHAKRDFVHAQLYELNLNPCILLTPSPMSAIQILSIEDICKKMQQCREKIYCIGSGLTRNSSAIKEICLNVDFLAIDKPCHDSLNMLAQIGTYEQKDLEPIYTRQCDAIDNLSSIAEKLGFNPEKQHEKLKKLLQRST